jgi:hypothetical protein
MLKPLRFKPGVTRENTPYASSGTWFDVNWVRFRSGQPEKIGGWQRISSSTYLGTCRSLTQWAALDSSLYTGVGTNVKYYIEFGGSYYDVTPIRRTVTLGANPFATTNGSATVTVTDVGHGGAVGDYVTFSGASAVAGLTLNAEYAIATVPTANTYTITASSNANATTTGGGAAVSAAYQLAIGSATSTPAMGWGSGSWGSGTWGSGSASTTSLRIWNHDNFGQNLIYGPKGGGLYYWTTTGGLTARGVLVSSLGGASDVPLYQNLILVSDINRFVLVFGTDEYLGSGALDPMCIRWSDQESVTNWTPSATTQAGGLRLSRGSKIVAAIQTRQEILTLTDTSVYSLQYVGPPGFWGATLVGDGISVMSDRAVATSSGVVYWMGVDKFYMYDGAMHTLDCDVRRYVFDDINIDAADECFAGVVEAFNEIWWFYCSEDSTDVDKYVVYNYVDKAWYYGSLRRSAWLQSGISQYPIAADYDNLNLVYHEYGVDDCSTSTPQAISAYITSAEVDLGDNSNFGFVWRVLPDVTFEGSSDGAEPQVLMTLYPLKNMGAGYTSPASKGGISAATVQRSVTAPIEEFTSQINTRVRGRQLVFKISSDQVGTQWQLGTPLIDVRPDGKN